MSYETHIKIIPNFKQSEVKPEIEDEADSDEFPEIDDLFIKVENKEDNSIPYNTRNKKGRRGRTINQLALFIVLFIAFLIKQNQSQS